MHIFGKGAGARGGDGGERAKQQQVNTPRVRHALVDLATVLLKSILIGTTKEISRNHFILTKIYYFFID